jgi:hypothetical protein
MMAEEIRVGEAGNLVTLKREEWNVSSTSSGAASSLQCERFDRRGPRRDNGGFLANAGDDAVDPVMQCVLCLETIPAGTGHYRVVERRFHIECWSAYWRRPATEG